MALAASASLTPHFLASELGADNPAATSSIVLNLYQTASWLEAMRHELGDRRVFASGFRTPARNAEVGGAPDSDHLVGLAADFTVEGLTPFDVYQKLNDAIRAGRLPAFDQLIFYAADDHVHVGLGARMRGEVLFRTTEGSYVALAGRLVTQLRGFV